MTRVNKRHEAFLLHLLDPEVNLNATEAYCRVYPGVDRVTAATNAGRLLRNAQIIARREELANEILDGNKAAIKVRLEQELRAIAFSRLSDYVDPAGEIDLNKLATVNPGAVKEFGKNGLKLQEKGKALELLAKYTGLVSEEVKVNIATETLAAIKSVVAGVPEEALD